MKVVVIIGAVAVLLAGGVATRRAFQPPAVRDLDPSTLREYAGVYQWGPDAFLYLQIWLEMADKNQLVALSASAAGARALR